MSVRNQRALKIIVWVLVLGMVLALMASVFFN
jgi:hypothetical protein